MNISTVYSRVCLIIKRCYIIIVVESVRFDPYCVYTWSSRGSYCVIDYDYWYFMSIAIIQQSFVTCNCVVCSYIILCSEYLCVCDECHPFFMLCMLADTFPTIISFDCCLLCDLLLTPGCYSFWHCSKADPAGTSTGELGTGSCCSHYLILRVKMWLRQNAS